MFNQSVATKMLNKHKVAVDILNSLEVLQVNYTGALSYSDLYVASPQTPNTHPFIATMGGTKYFSDLISQGAIMIAQYDDGNHKAGGVTYTNSSAALPNAENPLRIDTDAASSAQPVAIDLNLNYQGMYAQQSLSIEGVVTTHHIKDMSKFNTYEHVMLSDKTLPQGIVGSTGSAYFSAWEKLPSHAFKTASYFAQRAGVEVVPIGMSLFPQMMSANSARFANFGMPRINGFGRLLASWRCSFKTPTGETSWQECTIGFYVLGSGDDIRLVFNPEAGKYRDNATARDVTPYRTRAEWLMRRDKPVDAVSAYSIPHSTVKKYFPVSGNIYFGASVSGSMADQVMGTPMMFEEREIGTSEIDFNVTIATGQLLKNDYAEYLSTGYGIWKPFSEAAVTEVMKTWDRLDTSGLVYRIESTEVGSRSVKEFKAYSEYGKNRARACKDNNFLDLPYNQEYTWKQVENKLGEVRNLSIWMYDASTSTNEGQTLTTGEFIIRGFDSSGVEVTNPANAYMLRVTNSESGITKEFNFTESGVDSMLDLVGGSRVSDPNGFIPHLAGAPGDGAAVSDLNNAYKTFKAEDYRVDYVGQFTGVAPHYGSLGKDESLSYLIRQVTDYRHFRVQLPKLLSFFSANSIYASSIAINTEDGKTVA